MLFFCYTGGRLRRNEIRLRRVKYSLREYEIPRTRGALRALLVLGAIYAACPACEAVGLIYVAAI